MAVAVPGNVVSVVRLLPLAEDCCESCRFDGYRLNLIFVNARFLS